MDFQRILAFVVFSLSLLWLWEAWQTHNNPALNTPASAVATTASVEKAGANGVPSVNPSTPAVPSAEAAERGARAIIDTDVMHVEIDAHGGDIRVMTLNQYRANGNAALPFPLFQDVPGKPYFAQSGWVGAGLPTHKTVFSMAAGEHRLADGQDRLTLILKAQVDAVEVQKTYTFKRGSYVIDVAQTVVNKGPAAVSGSPYFQLLRHGQAPEGESAMMYTYTGPAMFTEAGKFQKIDFGSIAKDKQDHAKQANDGWMGLIQHHFVTAWLMAMPTDATPREFYTRSLGNDQFTAGVLLPTEQIAAGAEKSLSMRLYAGPQELDFIEPLAPGMEYVVDYGWLTVVAYPIFMLLKWIHTLIPNWGWAIIALTVLIKLAFYPLSAASYKSMAKMRQLAPRLQQLKERYGDDRQKLHEQMTKIYQEEKINPLGGCLPILVQIPVFIALYWVLMGAVELRQAPWALWITDLSARDPYYVLPVLMAVSMFVQQKLSPTPPDPLQAKIMMYMPIVFSIFFFFFPAGLVLYWIVNNLLSILQQWRINTVIGAHHGGGKH